MMRLLRRPTDSPVYAWVVVGTFITNYSLIDISALTIGLLLPDIRDEMGLTATQLGLISSAVIFGNLAFEIPANVWLSRYRPWRVASIAFIASAGFTALNGWAPSFIILLTMRLLLGVAYIVCKVPRTLVVLQWVPRRRIPLANGIIFSFIDSMGGVGFIVIPIILGVLGNWRLTLYAWTAITLVAILAWLVLGKDRYTPEFRRGMESQVGSPMKAILKYKEPWILGFGIGGTIAARFGFNSFWPIYARDEYELTLTFSGLVISMISLASTPGKIAVSVVPALVNRPSLVLTVCGIAMWVSFAGLLFTDSGLYLLLFGCVNGLSFCFIPLMMTQLYELPAIRPRELTVAVSLMFTILWAGGFLGPLVVGVIDDATHDLRLALLVISFGSLSLSLSGLLLKALGNRTPD